MTNMNETKNSKVTSRFEMEQNALFYRRFQLFWKASLKVHKYDTSSLDFHRTAQIKNLTYFSLWIFFLQNLITIGSGNLVQGE